MALSGYRLNRNGIWAALRLQRHRPLGLRNNAMQVNDTEKSEVFKRMRRQRVILIAESSLDDVKNT